MFLSVGPAFLTLLSGVVGTWSMLLFMHVLHLFNQEKKGNPILSIGLIFNRSGDHPFVAAILVYTVYGILFSFVYQSIFQSVPHDTTFRGIELGAFLGLLQGIVASILLVILVKEHHHLVKFRSRGFSIAFSNLFAHILYGAIVGLGRDLTLI